MLTNSTLNITNSSSPSGIYVDFIKHEDKVVIVAMFFSFIILASIIIYVFRESVKTKWTDKDQHECERDFSKYYVTNEIQMTSTGEDESNETKDVETELQLSEPEPESNGEDSMNSRTKSTPVPDTYEVEEL